MPKSLPLDKKVGDETKGGMVVSGIIVLSFVFWFCQNTLRKKTINIGAKTDLLSY
jgi:hypothetical protein